MFLLLVLIPSPNLSASENHPLRSVGGHLGFKQAGLSPCPWSVMPKDTTARQGLVRCENLGPEKLIECLGYTAVSGRAGIQSQLV